MISTVVRSLSRVPIPLRTLAVCVACEECFELGEPTCPSCGSDEYVPLLHLLEGRSEEHTSELQSQSNLVCRLLLEKKKKNKTAELSTYHMPPTSSSHCRG